MLSKDEKDALAMLQRFNKGRMDYTDIEVKVFAAERQEMRKSAQGINLSKKVKTFK